MKKGKKIIGVLIVFLSLFLSLFITNKSYLLNKKKGNSDYINYDVDSLEYINIDKDDNIYYLKNDNQIIIDLKHEDAKNLVFEGNIKELEPKVYFKNIGESDFTENQVLFPKLIKKDGQYILNLDLKLISSIRLDFEASDEYITISNIKIRSFYPQIGWLSFLFSLVFSIIIAVLVQIPFYKYKLLPEYFTTFFNYRFLLTNLVKKDITLKYRRSTLGIAWSVLNPLLMMLVTTAVFQKIFKSDIENFPIYYLTGSLIFNFVVEATNGCMNSMLEASPLIKKVYIPKYIFPMEKTLFALINMIFSLAAVIIIYVVLKIKPPLTALLFPIPIIYVMIFALGFGMILATLNVFFRDVAHLYGVFTTAWMYLTPIMYPIDILPGFVRSIVRINPLYYYVNYFRNIMYNGIIPNIRDNLICLLFSFAFLLVGILVFKRKQDKFVLYI